MSSNGFDAASIENKDPPMMVPKHWIPLVFLLFMSLGIEAFFGFALAFSPGWANGWPGGMTIYSVWSAGMSCVFFLMWMTTAAGVGAIAGAFCSHFRIGLVRGKSLAAGWLVASLGLGVSATVWVYCDIYASAIEMWPNGYNP